MHKSLQQVYESIESNQGISNDAKESLLKSLKAVDKELQILSFKLDRTEKEPPTRYWLPVISMKPRRDMSNCSLAPTSPLVPAMA